MIVDMYGRPFEKATLTTQQTDSPSVAHLHREYGTHPSSGLTPPKLAGILLQAELGDIVAQSELYQDMEEKDGHLLAEMGKRRRALTTVPWAVVPPRNATAAEKVEAAWLDEVMRDIPDFEDLLFDILDAIGKGFSNTEISWARYGSEWLPQAFTYREASWFQLDPETRTELRLRDGTMAGQPLNAFGWISHLHKAKSGYIARGGLYRVLAWPYMFKQYSVRDLAEFLEIYGLPLRVGTYHSGATDDEKRVLMRAVMNIGHSAAGIIPEGMKIEFEEAAKGGHDPFDWMVNWSEKTMSKAILGGTLTSQADGKSSTNALGNVHNDVRHDLLQSDARQVASTLRQHLLYPLLALNKAGQRDLRRMPQFVFDVMDPADFGIYSDAIPKLVSAGLPITTAWAYEKLNIPVPQDGEAVLSMPGSATPATAAATTHTAIAAAKTEQEEDPLGDLAELMASNWQVVQQMAEGPIQELLASCSSVKEFEQRLPELISTMNANQVAEYIAQGLFSAALAGRTDAV